MKKTLCFLLILILLLIPTVAFAADWSAASTTTTASPFSVEVIQLSLNADVTGTKYYTILNDSTAAIQNKIYYAVKLTLPSYTDANAFYGKSEYVSGSKVKISIVYENVIGKSKEVITVPLTDKAQTLWYNGASFEAAWANSTNIYTSNKCVLTATSLNTDAVKITATVGGKGALSDIKIDDCYIIAKKTFYGVKPCTRCEATDLTGYFVSGSCSSYGVFFSVNAAGKVTGVYVTDKIYRSGYLGSYSRMEKKLYQWKITGVSEYCYQDGCNHAKYGLVELPSGAIYSRSGLLSSGQVAESDGYFDSYCDLYGVDYNLRDMRLVYYEDEDGLYCPVDGTENFWPSSTYYYKDSSSDGYLEYADSNSLKYCNVYSRVSEYTDVSLYRMTSSTTVECDGLEKAFLNSANYVMRLLGISYEQIVAGEVYLTEDNLLTNFGFKTSVTDSKTWGTVVSNLVVSTMPTVPATGDAPIILYYIIVLLIGAAIFQFLSAFGSTPYEGDEK